MGVADYLFNRQKYARPQGMVFTEAYSVIMVPDTRDGHEGEFVATNYFEPVGTEYVDYIVLSDHNREEISLDIERLETRKRMINGRMRSVWLADKRKISTSWKDLPSRAASSLLSISGDNLVVNNDAEAIINQEHPELSVSAVPGRQFVVDKGAAAYDLAKWHKDHPGTFWVLLAFDQHEDLDQYTVALECFFDSFDYSISKRGRTMDLWNVSLGLEEA